MRMPIPFAMLLLTLASTPALAQDAPTTPTAVTAACPAATGEPPQAATACPAADAAADPATDAADDATADAATDAATAPPAVTATPEATPATGEPPAASPAAAPDSAATAPAVPAATSASDDDDTDAPTQAELDYAALYGGQGYDPVADPALPAPADLPASYDPWEGLNRKMHRFNNAVDRSVAKPLATAYVAVVPRPMRLGVGNFFGNLGQPVSALNALLQGKPKQAAQALGRFVLNATLGIGGLFDPASDANLPYHSEDFGQTLGTWGWQRSRYVELPLFGPRTLRDVFGLVGDAPLAPIRRIENDPTRVFLQGLQLVDVRTQLFAVDRMREGATDDYALVRDAWLQRRKYQISGDQQQHDDELPDYLREDTANPSVPADAMPVMPNDGY